MLTLKSLNVQISTVQYLLNDNVSSSIPLISCGLFELRRDDYTCCLPAPIRNIFPFIYIWRRINIGSDKYSDLLIAKRLNE